MDLATQLYILDDLAGVRVEREAAAVAAQLSRDGPQKARPFTIWLLGAWYAARGDSAATNALKKELARRAATTKDPWIARYEHGLSARLKLLAGDTATAMEQLRSVLGAGRRQALDWDIGESLAADRLLLAVLLLQSGRPAEARSVAGIFDHSAPAVFLPFLPASLAIRSEAALSLGHESESRRLQARLSALGHTSDRKSGYVPAP
jgi:hypothetical protein